MELKPYFLLMVVFVTALPADSQTTRQSHTSPSAQHFVCNIGYTQNECDEEMTVLRRALANYPAYQLGGWTWVLVRSEDWKLILLTSGLSPRVPALTVLGMRTTFFEEALLVGPISRVSELMTIWHMGREGLLAAC
jgi:hypothetical protein